ncbi:MAG: sensor histidine kinase [Chloroflexi bacterium]|nr:sensor histidine kinase [Chloroflexota bacterium]
MTEAKPILARDIATGQKTFIATVLAVYLAIFIFLRQELTIENWLILLVLGGTYVFVSSAGASHFARTGSYRVLIPAFALALLLAGAIVYQAAGFFLTGLILLPLASLGVQILPWPQAWLVDGLIISMLALAYGLRGGWEAALLAGVGYLAALFFVVFMTHTAMRERKARAEVEQLADELQAANRKLQAFADQAEELAITRERARLAHELHDTVGHTLTALDVQMALLAALPAGQTEQRRQAAAHARALVKEGLADMRRAVAALRPAALESFSLPVAIDGLVSQFVHTTGIHADWQWQGDEIDLSPRLALPLYRAVQEALTNIQRHAPSTPLVVIRLCYKPETVYVRVVNAQSQGESDRSGAGSKGGQGLAGLQERAEMLGGRFEAGPDGKGGFQVMMELPRTN